MEIILGVPEKHLEDNAGSSQSQHVLMREKSCLTNFLSFYDKVTHLVDGVKAVDFFFFSFLQSFWYFLLLYPSGQSV